MDWAHKYNYAKVKWSCRSGDQHHSDDQLHFPNRSIVKFVEDYPIRAYSHPWLM